MGLDCSKSAPVDPPAKQQHSDPLPFLRHSATTVDEIRITPGQFIKVNNGSYLKDYKVRRLLGEGGFGKVFEVEHKVSKMERAVKEIAKSKGNSDVDREKFIAEVSILAKLDHPNIMKIFELYEDAQKFYVVSELIRGGELFDFITKRESLSEVFAANTMKQVLSAVNYLHKQGIVHRDLKPENVMLEQEPNSVEELNLKLIDFGTSVSVPESGRLREAIGTMYYMAPEVLDRRYDSKCDVWSLGVILFVLIAQNTDGICSDAAFRVHFAEDWHPPPPSRHDRENPRVLREPFKDRTGVFSIRKFWEHIYATKAKRVWPTQGALGMPRGGRRHTMLRQIQIISKSCRAS